MSTLRVSIAKSIDDVDQAAWDRVVTASGAPVHYSLTYLRAFEKSPMTSVPAFQYLSVRDAGEVVAVLPCYLQESGDPLGTLRDAGIPAVADPALLAPTWYCYDGRIPLLPMDRDRADGVREAVLDTVAELRAGLDAGVAGLINVAEDDPLLDVARRRGWDVRPLITRYQLPTTELSTFDAYLATMSNRTAQTLRRQFRRAADAGIVVEVGVPRPDLLPAVADLCRHTASKFGSADFYPRQAFVDFVIGLGDRARLITVALAGELLAAAVGLLDDERFHMWIAGVGVDTVGPVWPNYLLWCTDIRTGIEMGKQLIEGGRSNKVFKERHGMRELQMYSCLVW